MIPRAGVLAARCSKAAVVTSLPQVSSMHIFAPRCRQRSRARREAAAFDQSFWSGEPLDGLFEEIGATPGGSSEKIFAAGMVEWRRSHRNDGGLIAGAQARIDRSMDVAINKRYEGRERIRVFLDELDPSAGRYESEPEVECGLFCNEMVEEVEAKCDL